MQFQNSLLLLPPTKINAFYASFFMNSVAFEHSCRPHCSKDITVYVVFMGCLLNTSADVSLLSQNKIIEKFFGTDKQVAKFFNSVAKCVPFDIRKSYLSGLFLEVNGYNSKAVTIYNTILIYVCLLTLS
ncbi:hypothetical protein HanRHA438_Chr02g0092211 [Helianthus annuus]|nr:hypothetical protein HanRHA438_Chr02g0092211 [Helianthus annuus]